MDEPRVRISRRSVLVLAVVVVVLVALAGLSVVLNRWHDTAGRRAAVPLDGRRTAIVEIDSGADRISVTSADLGGDLAVVTTPRGSGLRPRARVDGNRLRITIEDTDPSADGLQSGDSRRLETGTPAEINVRIARGVRWDVRIEKGTKQIALGLGSGQIHSIELDGGADHAEITLPSPTGVGSTRVRGGMSSIAFHVPAAVPVQLSFGSGAGSAVVDGQSHQGIASGTTITGAQNGTGPDRWNFDLVAGIGSVTLDRK